jgi:MazG family protein
VTPAAGPAVDRLVALIQRLRAPNGCAWDRRQTLTTMRKWLLEETYEVLDALDADDASAHRDELGDLLFVLAFQAELQAEAGAFTLADVADGVHAKMVRRHPHVFGDAPNTDEPMGLQRWEAQKALEDPDRSAVDGVPRAMPALARAERLGVKAGAVGLDWSDADSVLPVLEDELAELAEARGAGDADAIAHELGDVLFSAVNLARKLGVSPEMALQKANDRFEARFRRLESGVRADGAQVRDLPMAALDLRWQAAKRALAND